MLDRSFISDLSPLKNLSRLKKLSLKYCILKPTDVVEDLKAIKSLSQLALQGIKDSSSEEELSEADILYLISGIENIEIIFD